MFARSHAPRGVDLLPYAITALGELGACVVHDPTGGRDGTAKFVGMPYRPGRVLCAYDDGSGFGRELFVICPRPRVGAVRQDDQAVRAARLHERFVHRKADGWFNCFAPAFRAPRWAGELALIRYSIAKGTDELVEWEHYFEEPGEGPAYAQLYSVGHGQFYIPRGPWRVGPRGIEFTREETET